MWLCNFYAISAEALKLDPITLESLKKEKGFKMGKKHQKELDTMRKKHAKEKQTMQKNHCNAIEKLTRGKECVEIFLLQCNSIVQRENYDIIFDIILNMFYIILLLVKMFWRKMQM